MSVHTRVRLTSRNQTKRPIKHRAKTQRATPWRKAFKEEIEKFTEAGLVLRGSRLKEELTQQELAEALNVSQHHVSEMENGKRSIGKEMAKRLGNFFKTDYRNFL